MYIMRLSEIGNFDMFNSFNLIKNQLFFDKNIKLSPQLYRTITSTTQLTTSRHLSDLLKKGVLKKLNKNGRSSAYELDF